MKKLSLCAVALLLTAFSVLGQGVKIQAFTTNSGPVVTNIVVSLSSNLLPNRLLSTNTITGVRVFAATNGSAAGFWLDPATITPGQATNVISVAAGTGITIVSNVLLRTISTPAVTNNETRQITFQGAATLKDGSDNSLMAGQRKLVTGASVDLDWFNHILNHTEAANDSWIASAERMTNAPVSILRIADGTPLTNGTSGQALFSFGNGGVYWGSSFAGSGSQLTNLLPGNVAFNPQLLLDPPRLGPQTNPGSYFFHGNNSANVFFPGAGIMKHLWIQCELGASEGLNTILPNLRLEVFVDDGGTTNLNYRTIDVSLADLFGNRFRFITNGNWAVFRDSLGIQSDDCSTNSDYGGYIKTMLLKLPMPFTNGFRARITNSATGTLWTHGYMSPTLERSNSMSSLGAYANWKLRSATAYGPGPNGVASNFLFRATGAGMCVGLMTSVLGTNIINLSYFDSIGPTFYTQGTIWEPSGGDDLFLSTYAMKTGFTVGYSSGVINRWYGPQRDSNGFAIEAYRWFGSSGPYWSDTVDVYIPDTTGVPARSVTMFYYSSQ